MALGRKARESVNTIEQLLKGLGEEVTWDWQHRKRHLMLRLYVGKEVGVVTVSVTASDARARMNQVADVKRELRGLGVEL